MTAPNDNNNLPHNSIAAELASTGYTLTTLNPSCSPRSVDALRRSCYDLDSDPYSPRHRGFGRYVANPDSSLRDRLYEGYEESSNAAVGDGVVRYFAPLEPLVRANAALRQIIMDIVAIYRTATGTTGVIEIGLHQIRVHAAAHEPGEATPEKRHHDGNTAFGAVLLNRHCTGGETLIYDTDETLVEKHTMTQALDVVLCIDHRVSHEVTPITPPPGSTTGFRDVLIVDLYDEDNIADVINLNPNDSRPGTMRRPIYP